MLTRYQVLRRCVGVLARLCLVLLGAYVMSVCSLVAFHWIVGREPIGIESRLLGLLTGSWVLFWFGLPLERFVLAEKPPKPPSKGS